MAKKRKGSSLDTPACHLVTTSLITLTALQRSQREIATPDLERQTDSLARQNGALLKRLQALEVLAMPRDGNKLEDS
jgi:hypothetical protein